MDGKLVLVEGEKNYDYVVVQLTEHLDIIDYEQSDYKMTNFGAGRIKPLFNKLVLQTPENGFPPIFRLKDKPQHLLVSEEVQKALVENGMRGIEFVKVSKQPF